MTRRLRRLEPRSSLSRCRSFTAVLTSSCFVLAAAPLSPTPHRNLTPPQPRRSLRSRLPRACSRRRLRRRLSERPSVSPYSRPVGARRHAGRERSSRLQPAATPPATPPQQPFINNRYSHSQPVYIPSLPHRSATLTSAIARRCVCLDRNRVGIRCSLRSATDSLRPTRARRAPRTARLRR